MTFTIVISDTIHEIEVTGNTWETGWVDLTPLELGGEYAHGVIDVEIAGCDQSGKCTTIHTSIDTSNIELSDLTEPSTGDSVESTLPASGMPSMVIAFSMAIFLRRRSLE